MTKNQDKIGWLRVEVDKLIREFSIEDILSVLSRRARLDYENVYKAEQDRKPGTAGHSPGAVSSYKRLYEKLKEWENNNLR